MRGTLDVDEVVEFAVRIEQNGYRFYVDSLEKLSDPRIEELWTYLADEEKAHERAFSGLKKKIAPRQLPEAYAGEYEAHMWDFLKSHALADADTVTSKVESLGSLQDAVEIALEFEKDSIILFTMLKDLIDEKSHPTVDAIIGEELTHIRRINGVLHRLTST